MFRDIFPVNSPLHTEKNIYLSYQNKEAFLKQVCIERKPLFVALASGAMMTSKIQI